MYKSRPQKLLFWGLLLVYIQFILLSYFAGRKMKSAFKNLSKMCGRVKAHPVCNFVYGNVGGF